MWQSDSSFRDLLPFRPRRQNLTMWFQSYNCRLLYCCQVYIYCCCRRRSSYEHTYQVGCSSIRRTLYSEYIYISLRQVLCGIMYTLSCQPSVRYSFMGTRVTSVWTCRRASGSPPQIVASTQVPASPPNKQASSR